LCSQVHLEAETDIAISTHAVEKVVVGPVGSPKQVPNKLKNTTKTGFSAPE
jgi:hypothetical protein